MITLVSKARQRYGEGRNQLGNWDWSSTSWSCGMSIRSNASVIIASTFSVTKPLNPWREHATEDAGSERHRGFTDGEDAEP